MKSRFTSILFQITMAFFYGLVLVMIWTVYSIEDRRNEMIQNAVDSEVYLIEKIVNSIYIDDKEKEDLLESLEGKRNVAFLEVEEGKLEKIVVEDGFYNNSRIKIVSYPWSSDKFLRVGIFLKNAYKNHKELLKEYAVIFSLGMILSGAVFYSFLKEIIYPIKELKMVCEKVKAGEIKVNFKKSPQNEIGELMFVFKEMLEEVERSRMELKETNAILEIKVRARTKELEELAQGLEEKVRERTRELKEKTFELQKKENQLRERVNELEKFHNVVLGREIKMIELKQKIKELEEKLNREI